MELKQAMQKALDFEKKGFDIYIEAAEKTQNPIVRKTFEYLAVQEKNHIAEIKAYIETENPDIELKGDTLDGVKKIFNMTVKEFKEKTQLSEDDKKAHETALKLEEDAYHFYRELYEKETDEKLKKFFKFLMEQENAHFKYIEKSYQFIKDPEGFYAETEGWLFEGG